MIRRLVIANGRGEREILRVGNITIGRDSACHVTESDPPLSRRHAENVANIHGVSIRDLNSRNGLLVNGEKTREQVLLPGDVVQMGHLQLRYIEDNVRATDGISTRGMKQRRQAPPTPSNPAFDLDRFRPEPTPPPPRWTPEATPLPGRRTTAPPDATMSPGDATFASALAHLAGLADPGHEHVLPGPGARLVANEELTVTDATPACAELLGIPDAQLIGDSLTDVFLRGVRCAYAAPGSTLSLSISRGAHGSITVTFALRRTGGTR